MFGKNKSGAGASANSKLKTTPSAIVGASPRRIKEMAQRMKPFVEQARAHGMPTDAEGLDFVAGLFGFESYQAACQIPEAFSMAVGVRREKSGSIFGGKKKSDPFVIDSQEALGGTLLFGSTGAGKSEALITMALAALDQSPAMGMLMMDGKGDYFLQRYWLGRAREMGREHDFRILNLMGAHPHWPRDNDVPTQRFDPMFGMDATRLARWLRRSLGERMLGVGPARDLPSPDDAQDLMEALLMVWAQDAMDLASDPAQEPGVAALVAAAALPERAMDSEPPRAKAWRVRFSALMEDPQWRLAASAMKTRALAPLSAMLENYASAFRCAKDDSGAWLEPEIRPDSFLAGKICLTLLPALERSPEELEDLGRLVCCSFQDAMESEATAVGFRSIAILDEFGYYGPDVPGFVAAARGAGVGLILAAQDLWACKPRSWGKSAEANAKWLAELSNLRVKVFMKSEDPSRENLAFAHAALGPSLKPDALDLKDQREGEAWVGGCSKPGRIRFDYRGRPDRSLSDKPPATVKCPRRAYGG